MTGRVLALVACEMRKARGRAFGWVAAGLTAALALGAAAAYGMGAAVDRLAGEGGGEPLSGFGCLARAASAGLLAAATAAVVASARSLAEESERGTLRALLVAPVRRLEVLAAKSLHAVLGAAALAALAFLAATAGGAFYGYQDLPLGRLDRLTVGDMAGEAAAAAGLVAWALAALALVALSVGGLVRNAAVSVGLCLGGLAALVLAGTLVDAVAPWSLAACVADPLEVLRLNVSGYFERTLDRRLVLRGLVVPALWAVPALAVAALGLARRDVTE